MLFNEFMVSCGKFGQVDIQIVWRRVLYAFI